MTEECKNLTKELHDVMCKCKGEFGDYEHEFNMIDIRLIARFILARDKRIVEPLVKSAQELLYWHKKAHETPEMLLSSHAKSDECAEIMRKYFECFTNLQRAIDQTLKNAGVE